MLLSVSDDIEKYAESLDVLNHVVLAFAWGSFIDDNLFQQSERYLKKLRGLLRVVVANRV